MHKSNASITCKYLPFYFGGRYKFFPLLKVNIAVKVRIQTLGLVDSGSTNTFLPYGLAKTIGLLDDMKKLGKSTSTGASGQFKTHVGSLKRMEVLKGDQVFARFNGLPVHIPAKDEVDLPYMILGRDSIFKRYAITFHENKRKFTLEKC